jgi:hypothetical protein
VVEGRVEDGRMAELRVTPECRRTDVVIERNIPGVRYIPKDK